MNIIIIFLAGLLCGLTSYSLYDHYHQSPESNSHIFMADGEPQITVQKIDGKWVVFYKITKTKLTRPNY